MERHNLNKTVQYKITLFKWISVNKMSPAWEPGAGKDGENGEGDGKTVIQKRAE